MRWIELLWIKNSLIFFQKLNDAKTKPYTYNDSVTVNRPLFQSIHLKQYGTFKRRFDTERHTEKSNHTEKTLKPYWKALQKIITLKFSL